MTLCSYCNQEVKRRTRVEEDGEVLTVCWACPMCYKELFKNEVGKRGL
jgi:ribosome-binding protein aMBF1 (putative translation factor)